MAEACRRSPIIVDRPDSTHSTHTFYSHHMASALDPSSTPPRVVGHLDRGTLPRDALRRLEAELWADQSPEERRRSPAAAMPQIPLGRAPWQPTSSVAECRPCIPGRRPVVSTAQQAVAGDQVHKRAAGRCSHQSRQMQLQPRHHTVRVGRLAGDYLSLCCLCVVLV